MKKLFQWYSLIFPYILFLNILSFGSDNLGLGSIIFILINLFFVFNFIFFHRIKLNKAIFFGFLSFLTIQIFKIFFHNVGDITFSSFVGYLGNWVLFILNFVFSSLFFRSSLNKVSFIKLLSYFLLFSSIIGIIHYYLFFEIPFLDTSYGSDEVGTVFNIADYDLMRFRESSIFFGPNVNAYMALLGYLSMIFSIIDIGILNVFKSPRFWIFSIIHIWNIVISDSRSGFIVLIILIILMIYDKSIITHKISKFFQFLIFLAFSFFIILYVYNQPRLNSEALLQDGRVFKIFTGIEIFFSNNMNILIGAPINFKWIIGDISVSDNMYIALFLYVGLLGFIFLFMTVFYIINRINYLLKLKIDLSFNLFAKYYLILILLIGLFSIPIAMLPPMIYLGLILGGVRYNEFKHL